jgi:hypothetical protein
VPCQQHQGEQGNAGYGEKTPMAGVLKAGDASFVFGHVLPPCQEKRMLLLYKDADILCQAEE